MRVLGSSVLVFEWIVMALAIPVAVNAASVPVATAWVVFALVSALILAALAMLSRPVGVGLGWAVQAIMVLSVFVVPLLGLLGVLFAGLYLMAVRLGGRVDRAKAAQSGAASGLPKDNNVGRPTEGETV